VGSYRTYEEWKRIFGFSLTQSELGSYRTYEEWKHRSGIGKSSETLSSYRTYEEWKLATAFLPCHSLLVLTVPMRNGNLGRHKGRH